jgi:predicted RNA-binding protein with PIN domain
MKELIVVDGYNFIFNFYKAKKITNTDLSHLRDRLISDLSQLKNYMGCNITVVFDAKNRENFSDSIEMIGGVEVIYSKRGETADTIVEKLVNKQSEFEQIFVVTSDYSQQKVVFKGNIYRKSIREFSLELRNFKKKMSENLEQNKVNSKNSFYLIENRVDSKTKKELKEIRIKK